MRKDTLSKLCCPFDKADLELTVILQDVSRNILEGFLVCKECKRIYPIVSGIPILSPDEYREFKLEKPVLERWSKHLKGRSIENFRLIDEKNGKIIE